MTAPIGCSRVFYTVDTRCIRFQIQHLRTVKGINVIKTDNTVFHVYIGNICVGNRNGVGAFRRAKGKDTEFIGTFRIWLFLCEHRTVLFIIAAVCPPENLHVTVSVKTFQAFCIFLFQDDAYRFFIAFNFFRWKIFLYHSSFNLRINLISTTPA